MPCQVKLAHSRSRPAPFAWATKVLTACTPPTKKVCVVQTIVPPSPAAASSTFPTRPSSSVSTIHISVVESMPMIVG